MITTRAALCFVLVTVPSLAAVPGCGGPPLSHPAIGRVVRAFEDWWIAEDFPQDQARLAHALSGFVKANRT